MQRLPDQEYPICLLDTLAVSEMIRRPTTSFRSFLEWSAGSAVTYVPAFTVYTLIELRRRPDLFAGFIELFDQAAGHSYAPARLFAVVRAQNTTQNL